MRFYYFNSTHWDREWYQSFQQYRKYLVDTAELLMKCYDGQPGFSKFTFDGQTIVLHDITELRPSLREGLKREISAGRLNVGPWYVMPDEFLVSLEALVRNLQTGREIAKEFGGAAWPVGYICDIFGHVAQMPQIMRGFGLEGTVVWRGFPTDKGARLLWRSPDGTEIPVIRLIPRNGYANFTLEVRGTWNRPLDEQTFKKRFSKWVETNRGHFGEAFVLSDALDHCQPYGGLTQLFRWIKELYPDAEVIHSDYRDYLAAEYGGTLPVTEGEQLVSAENYNGTTQISATLSSRYDVKLANDTCQSLLELQAEPQAAIRAICGQPLSPESLRYAWRHTLQNHAHDSICGCSIDQVHREVLVRFDEVRTLAGCFEQEFRFLDRKALTGLDIYDETFDGYNTKEGNERMELLKAEADPDGVYLLRIFNPLPATSAISHRVTLMFPTSVPYPKLQAEPFFHEHVNCFRIYGESGQELPYSINGVERNQLCEFHRGDYRNYDLVTITFQPELRGSGWTTFTIRPAEESAVRFYGTLRSGRTEADNGILKLAVLSDGTFTVTDKRTGHQYGPFNNVFIDREIGDGWNHVAPYGEPVWLDGGQASVRLLTDNPVRAEYEITRTLRVPRELVFKGSIHESYSGIAESAECAELAIRTCVALDKGSDTLTLRTEMDNTLRDCRIRLEFPTGIDGRWFASQCGYIVQRNPGREHGAEREAWLEREHIGRNVDGILGKRDERGGVAVLTTAGMHEGGCLDDASGTLFITLLRAFRRTVHKNGETEGQLNKHLTWEYGLRFFTRDTSYTEMAQGLQALRAPVTAHLVARSLVKTEPEQKSMLSIDGSLLLSCFKPAADDQAAKEGTVIVRLVNLSDRPQEGVVRFAKPFRQAFLCRLDEEGGQLVVQDADSVSVTASAWQFVTLKVRF